MLLRHGKTITLAIKQGWHRFQSKRKNVLPVDEGPR
jgi:type VI secretion system protein ImpL